MRAYEVREVYPSNKCLRQLQGTNIQPALYVVLGTNRHIILINEHGKALHNIHQLVVNDTVKVPLYKQAMDFQMGRVPKTHTTTQSIMNVREIAFEDDRNYSYKVIMARV